MAVRKPGRWQKRPRPQFRTLGAGPRLLSDAPPLPESVLGHAVRHAREHQIAMGRAIDHAALAEAPNAAFLHECVMTFPARTEGGAGQWRAD